MAEISGLVDLRLICTGLVYKMGLEQYYATKFYQFGIECVSQLKLYTLGGTKVEKLEMDSDLGTISFPSDFLKFIDVAVAIGGSLWSLTRKNSIINTTTLINGQETYDSDIGEGLSSVFNQRAAGGSNFANYKIDEKERRITITGIDPTTVFLIYISTGVEADDITYVNRAIKPAIEAFIRWQYFLNAPNTPANKIPLYEDNFRKERNKLKRFKMPTLTQIRDSLYETFYRIAK